MSMTRSSHGLDTDPAETWQERAACRNADAEMFFPDGSAGRGSNRHARRICGDCDVREDCLAYALEIESGLAEYHRHGVWGGLDARERWQWEQCHTGVCEHGEHQR